MPRPRQSFPFSLRHVSLFDVAVGLLLALLFFLLISAGPHPQGPLDRADHLPPHRSTCWDSLPRP